MSVEQELKLHVQAASRQAVKEIIDTASAETMKNIIKELNVEVEDRVLRQLPRLSIYAPFTLTPVLENSHKQALHFACAKKMAFGYKPSNYPVMML